ncbi:coenzyme F420-reducing hydrogenase beta subunit [Clostridium pascui]|uniref:Coenzyme F420 hydrogenase/dehydrogenase, beta subunit C-terminal domain n=1 Tax=Clostridium pascui TaxID=46609 RepID=UPI0019586154|nr:Coenzyme F420 hydrogenase/dehydrogenase, beta subunit C-terminal domain [Clostridium pascui]MBM7869850.1 coenzyme F420-reducing hydrogenase beta subunit [Clostridium pascui]
MITINDKKDCMGCHACSNICPKSCITMKSDSEGFWYPSVDYNKCIKCGVCVKVCPIINKTVVQNNPRAYACYNKNETVRLESSSGGIFTLFAEHIINNGGVVFGAVFDKSFSVVHSYVETKEGLERFRGSKYVQSKIGDTYKQAKEFLDEGTKVLFTGTPCQIGGLKSYLQKDYGNLFCIDIICHGVPSPKVWEKYISYQQNWNESTIRKIIFRSKDKGWKRYSVSVSFNNAIEYLQTFDKDLFMKAFLKNICLRPSCYKCDFKTLHRQSDITLADFWGIQNVLPDMDDDKGTSLIFVNSIIGQYMLENIKDKILYKETDINEAIFYNSSAIKSVKYNPKRENFFKEINQLSFDKLVQKYCSDNILVRIKKKLKAVVRTILKKIGLLVVVKKLLEI